MTEPRSGHPLPPEHSNALLIPVLFFFSGACGLVYEVAWARMLTVLFGTTLFAVSTVLSAFMAGLALGSFLFGRWLDRLDRPLRVFALLEFGIGLFALLFPWIVSGLGRIYGAYTSTRTASTFFHSSASSCALRFCWCPLCSWVPPCPW